MKLEHWNISFNKSKFDPKEWPIKGDVIINFELDIMNFKYLSWNIMEGTCLSRRKEHNIDFVEEALQAFTTVPK